MDFRFNNFLTKNAIYLFFSNILHYLCTLFWKGLKVCMALRNKQVHKFGLSATLAYNNLPLLSKKVSVLIIPSMSLFFQTHPPKATYTKNSDPLNFIVGYSN